MVSSPSCTPIPFHENPTYCMLNRHIYPQSFGFHSKVTYVAILIPFGFRQLGCVQNQRQLSCCFIAQRVSALIGCVSVWRHLLRNLVRVCIPGHHAVTSNDLKQIIISKVDNHKLKRQSKCIIYSLSRHSEPVWLFKHFLVIQWKSLLTKIVWLPTLISFYFCAA